MNNIIVLCDFDGTITIEDTGVVALDNFTDEDWRYYDELLEQEEITLEECIKTQFEMLEGKKEEILEVLIKSVRVRPNAERFIEFCHQNNIPFVILSAGLDFAINYYKEKFNNSHNIPIYAPKAEFLNNKVRLSFPPLEDEKSKNFKQDIVLKYNKKNNISIYIGNGLSDFEGVRVADFAYVVKDSKLANLCNKEEIAHKEFADFAEIITDIKNRFKG
jgi:2,3-diketo-5-methylthio-1-phosphopentane phosphatase